ncbi:MULTISPECIES: TadE/TadG family type IV pilus assembly protein [unclassified Pannonibacter]|uniref:TadE/TadG family type IV pilus assembly protein n=2 Tax=unclassified Pannonibacter TaxID=2627228 RepID=UPI001644AF78|nr:MULTISPECIES: TadE/TadG family type IV pilus assembly protein [unclassified Pannonibacter]
MCRSRIRQLLRKMRQFGRKKDGSILPLAAFLIVIMIVIAGSGADYGRAVIVRSAVANALDAAVLSVARQLSTTVLTESQIRSSLESAFNANLTSTGVDKVRLANLSYTLDPAEGIITANVTGTIDTYFISIGGIGPETIPVRSSSQSTYSRFDVELSLIVDVTGSMSEDMDALKSAANSVVDILLADQTSNSLSKVRISLVPYSQGVNLGSYAKTVTNGAALGANCVTERMGPQQFTDAAYNYNGTNSEFFGGGSNACSSGSSLLPLTSSANNLKTAIKNLVASGGTAGQTGIAWGWYTLSPNWSNLWPSASAPSAYNSNKVKKIALIMTDGDFNDFYDKTILTRSQCQYRSGYIWPSSYQGWNNHDTRPGYYWLFETVKNGCSWSASQYWQGQYFHSATYNDEPSVRARKFCDAMKAKNITIYTVLFQNTSGSLPSSERLMKYCATSEATTYFKATDSKTLINAFSNIARQIQSIYLSK